MPGKLGGRCLVGQDQSLEPTGGGALFQPQGQGGEHAQLALGVEEIRQAGVTRAQAFQAPAGQNHLGRLDPLGALPGEVETLRLSTEIAFDLPAACGRDLRGLELVERKRWLRELLPSRGAIRYSEHVVGRGRAPGREHERQHDAEHCRDRPPRIPLDAAQTHYLRSVLRARPGQVLRIPDPD